MEERKCKKCGCILSHEKKKNKFCSLSCAVSFNNTGVVRAKHKLEQFCLVCNNSIKGNKIRKYCSCACKAKHDWQLRKEEITKSGCLIAKDHGYGYNPQVSKRYLIEMRGHRCDICKNETWLDQPIPLVLDHANGDPTDNSLENVRLVCGNCNMQLPTFAGKNRGKGRKNRR